MTQANREKIYNMLSPNILKKKAKLAELNAPPKPQIKKEIKKLNVAPPPVTAMVDNAVVCQTTVAKPTNVEVAPPTPLVISPNEGKPAVNGQAVKLDIRPIGIKTEIDPGTAAIPQVEKKKGGRPRKNPVVEK
jgi:hypothetical protein